MKNILIIEDDISLCKELKELLDNAGYNGIVIKSFENVLQEIIEINPDLVLLDINIPNINGQTLLQNLRKKSNVPVIMVTSKAEDTDEVLSISYGADDYITKPYNPTILLLRIGAILKRVDKITDFITYKELKIYPNKGIIKTKEEEIILTKNEMLIFNYLLSHKERLVTRDELMTELWNNDEYINDNTLTVNISRLRGKLKSIGYENMIETRKKIGYILL